MFISVFHRTSLRAPLTLILLCLLSTGVLAWIHFTAKDKIAYTRMQYKFNAFSTILTRTTELPFQTAKSAQVPKALKSLINRVMATGKAIDNSQVVDMMYYVSRQNKAEHSPYTLEIKIPELYILQLNGRGFGGPLELLAAYRPDGTLYHAILMDNQETPGFGKKAEDPTYMQIFWDRGKPANRIPVTRPELNGLRLEAISGSTISFRAIANALAAGAHWLAHFTKNNEASPN